MVSSDIRGFGSDFPGHVEISGVNKSVSEGGVPSEKTPFFFLSRGSLIFVVCPCFDFVCPFHDRVGDF